MVVCPLPNKLPCPGGLGRQNLLSSQFWSPKIRDQVSMVGCLHTLQAHAYNSALTWSCLHAHREQASERPFLKGTNLIMSSPPHSQSLL